jgi:ergothioneine biosynthesis protein EgtB
VAGPAHGLGIARERTARAPCIDSRKDSGHTREGGVMGSGSGRRSFEDRFTATWARTDQLFGIVPPDAILTRPIALRHPFIFYVGHLPAFAWNHVCRGVLGRESFDPRFDEMFERGIDPDVDDPERCHAHPEVPDTWPELKQVIAYRDQVRDAILESVDQVEARGAHDVMARKRRVLSMVIEHELMHQETLLYIVQQLDPALKLRPDDLPGHVFGDGAPSRAIEIPAGAATLGADFEGLDFGWDNEFPSARVHVPGFVIDSTPVTNEQYLAFVESGAYDRAEFWAEEDFAWKTRAGIAHPLFWSRPDGEWHYRGLFDLVPLSRARHWPAYVSLAEAEAYARWSGARLPTEAEFHRAAYGEPGGGERSFPWGEEPPASEHGNFHFGQWSPRPVGSSPRGASAWGVHELAGNGWEWTATPFAPFAGFQAYIPGYPGYSADFFDGKHFVLKGASWATDAALVRRSFRNWYQARYPYVFAKFRCVRSR